MGALFETIDDDLGAADRSKAFFRRISASADAKKQLCKLKRDMGVCLYETEDNRSFPN